MSRQLSVVCESFPIEGGFRVSRGRKTTADVVVVEIADGAHVGRGECVPYPRYRETPQTVRAAIESVRADVESGAGRQQLLAALGAGAARNALDCALWDLESKQCGTPVWRIAGLPEPQPVVTCFTLDLAQPAALRERARDNADRPLLKLKVGAAGDLERVAAVREGAPEAAIVLDANEGWSVADLAAAAPRLVELGVALIEQPLAASDDAMLDDLSLPIEICADESFHTAADLDRVVGRYDVVNIKLDKTGGLTEALATVEAARARGLRIMVGCMVSSSLAIAPAHLLAQGADWVDLDGAMLLAEDRDDAIRSVSSTLYPPDTALWGG